jgi:hypothetical protein
VTYVLVFTVNYIVCTVFSAVHLCIFIVICYVCTNIRIAATELKLDFPNNNNIINSNNGHGCDQNMLMKNKNM